MMFTENTTNTTNTTSPVRGVMTYVMGAIAFLTCPCHLPVLLFLLSGTAAGSYLSQNLGTAITLLLVVFLLSAIATWRLLDQDGSEKPVERPPRDPQPRATAPLVVVLPRRKDNPSNSRRP